MAMFDNSLLMECVCQMSRRKSQTESSHDQIYPKNHSIPTPVPSDPTSEFEDEIDASYNSLLYIVSQAPIMPPTARRGWTLAR